MLCEGRNFGNFHFRVRRRVRARVPAGASGPSFSASCRFVAHAFVITIVGPHDALNQGVPHDVALIEIHESDPFHATQNLHRIDQSAALS